MKDEKFIVIIKLKNMFQTIFLEQFLVFQNKKHMFNNRKTVFYFLFLKNFQKISFIFSFVF